MGDKLFHLPVLGLVLTELGRSITTDNHGNSIRGSTLYCAATKRTVSLPTDESIGLYMDVGRSNVKDYVPDGVTEVVSGLSPLQRHCNARSTIGTSP